MVDWRGGKVRRAIGTGPKEGRTVVVYHFFDVFHDFCVAAVGLGGHGGDGAAGFEDAGGLGVEDERDGEEAFDPFCVMC